MYEKQPVWRDGQSHLAIPEYVWYRGRKRRVYGIIPARHQRHLHYILRYNWGTEPKGSSTMAFGTRGQRKFIGVAVRSDHTRPYRRQVQRTGKRGRPRNPRWKGQGGDKHERTLG